MRPEKLRAHGCDVAQGYRIAQPLMAAGLPGWVGARDAGGYAKIDVRRTGLSTQS